MLLNKTQETYFHILEINNMKTVSIQLIEVRGLTLFGGTEHV